MRGIPSQAPRPSCSSLRRPPRRAARRSPARRTRLPPGPGRSAAPRRDGISSSATPPGLPRCLAPSRFPREPWLLSSARAAANPEDVPLRTRQQHLAFNLLFQRDDQRRIIRVLCLVSLMLSPVQVPSNMVANFSGAVFPNETQAAS